MGTRNIQNFDLFFIGIVKNDNLSRVSTVQAVHLRRNRSVTIDSRISNFLKLSKMSVKLKFQFIFIRCFEIHLRRPVLTELPKSN
jgi:hypothetical protein